MDFTPLLLQTDRKKGEKSEESKAMVAHHPDPRRLKRQSSRAGGVASQWLLAAQPNLPGSRAMAVDALTEAEFRAFSERLHGFAQDLAPKERLFLMAILARASSRGDSDIVPSYWDAEWAVSGELAFAIWQSMSSPRRSISLNPQALPLSQERTIDQ
jgi:hypothetical protein